MLATIDNDDAQYALDIVEKICREVGPGLPGSSQERERAELIQKELESHLGTENVFVEKFSMAPAAFLSVYPISALFILMAALLNVSTGRLEGISPGITAFLAVAFSAIAVILIILEFILGFEFIDPLFKKKQSLNVIGILRKPEAKNVKRLLILSGHHDSAPENTWLRFLGDLSRSFTSNNHRNTTLPNTLLSLLGYGFLIASITWIIGLFTTFVMSIIQLIGLIAGRADIVHFGTLGWVILTYPIVPSSIFAFFFTRAGKNGGTVPGAADNLSACALVVAMCRFLVENPFYVPSDTEIRFISFGSEEAGLRGSRRYVARHLDELKLLDTRLLNFETVAHHEILILSSDVSGTVKNSPEMLNGVVTAAKRAGVSYKVISATLGVANDSGSFSKAGLKATTLLPFKMPEQMVSFYHQKSDGPENLTKEPLNNLLKLTFEWVVNGGE